MQLYQSKIYACLMRVIKNRYECKQIKVLRSQLLKILKFRTTCHGLMHNIAIIRYRYQEGFKRRKVVVDFHIALLRVIGYCIRSVEFHDTEHVNGTCVNLLRKS